MTALFVPLAMIGFQELWPILLIVLLLFGARKLPELARAMGTSITQFKKGLADEDEAKRVESAKADEKEA